MTRQQYSEIARIIRSISDYDPDAGYHTSDVAWVFAEELAKTDPTFDRVRFEAEATEGIST